MARTSTKLQNAALVMLAADQLDQHLEACFSLFGAGVTQRCLRQSQEGAVHAARHCSRSPRSHDAKLRLTALRIALMHA
eukprot:42127-Eustigmatos_ZCMA.PRE.1